MKKLTLSILSIIMISCGQGELPTKTQVLKDKSSGTVEVQQARQYGKLKLSIVCIDGVEYLINSSFGFLTPHYSGGEIPKVITCNQ